MNWVSWHKLFSFRKSPHSVDHSFRIGNFIAIFRNAHLTKRALQNIRTTPQQPQLGYAIPDAIRVFDYRASVAVAIQRELFRLAYSIGAHITPHDQNFNTGSQWFLAARMKSAGRFKISAATWRC